MRFTWDENKNRANRGKHGIDFEDARLVFFDEWALTQRDREVNGEQRWRTLGLVLGTVVLAVFHTWREEGDEEIIRIISARKATTHERKEYDSQFGP
jgi:uncharacterized protein